MAFVSGTRQLSTAWQPSGELLRIAVDLHQFVALVIDAGEQPHRHRAAVRVRLEPALDALA